MNKPSVFISYAHKDGLEFTRRLAYALGFYMDVFWDRQLQMSEYPKQLYDEIESRDFLILVMSPASIASTWCRDELAYAESHSKGIGLARIYNGDEATDVNLTSKYTYGDFVEDFEQGFRRLTQMMLGQPYSSWEVLPHARDDTLLNYFDRGMVPSLIAKEIAEWIIVDVLWPYVEDYLAEQDAPIFRGNPRTPVGIRRLCDPLIEQFTYFNNIIGVLLIEETQKITDLFIQNMITLKDENHHAAGKFATEIINTTKELLCNQAEQKIDAKRLMTLQQYFDFNITEKLRELINMHARRSRYLY
jgi:hypothetical protein